MGRAIVEDSGRDGAQAVRDQHRGVAAGIARDPAELLDLEQLIHIGVLELDQARQARRQSVERVDQRGPLVEEFLGQLEGQGYLADRLELPALDQLQATPITDDGAWIYPEASGGQNMALVAWWYGGVLQNLDLIVTSDSGLAHLANSALVAQLMHGHLAVSLSGSK